MIFLAGLRRIIKSGLIKMIHSIKQFNGYWTTESKITHSIMSALTDESLSQRISNDHRTLGSLAWHVVLAIPAMIGRTGLKLVKLGEVKYDSPVPHRAKDIQDSYKILSEELPERIEKEWTDETLLEEHPFHFGKIFKKGFTLQLLINHQIHHRGQMTLLMRQAGLVVPSVYGPNKEESIQIGLNFPLE